MSGAQMAHFLKQVGKGSELAGIAAVYRTGWLVGAGQTLTAMIAAYGVYRLGKWGYEKLIDYLQERGYIGAAGEVVERTYRKTCGHRSSHACALFIQRERGIRHVSLPAGVY